MSTRSASPRSAARSRASAACGSESVMPTTLTPCRSAAWMREAAPAAAHVEHALALLERELRADQLELRLLRLLERLRAAREDRAAVGHRVAQEQREEVVRDVVVVAHRARVALEAVAPAARAQLRLRRRAAGAGRPTRAPPRARAGPARAGRAAAAASRRAPRARRRGRRRRARRRRTRGPRPSCPGASSACAKRVRRAHVEGGPAAVRRRQRSCRPTAPRERPRRERALPALRGRARCGRACAREGTVRAWPTTRTSAPSTSTAR